METISNRLRQMGFGLACIVLLVSPWCFGAWEVWWFWLFAAVLFASVFFFALRLQFSAMLKRSHSVSGLRRRERSDDRLSPNAESRARRTWAKTTGVLACLPFLAYAVLRWLQPCVFADAQRSVLLFLTPFLLAAQIVFGLGRKNVAILFGLIAVDLLLLGVYGIGNHLITGSRLVLWAPGYPQYTVDSRATGSYFCPNHFSGLMEIALALGLGLLLARETSRPWRTVAAILSLVALTGVVLSKSRGGGLVVLAILAAALVWGFDQWRPAVRWAWRGGMALAAALALTVFLAVGKGYTERFGAEFGWSDARHKPLGAMAGHVWDKARHSVRGVMISAALRAWREHPLLGIGPGMHQHLWPHFAASPDGDRERGIWPSQLNNQNYSYEVHSDWVQLLEEYGLVGLVLFLGAAGSVFGVLCWGIRRERQSRVRHEWGATGRKRHGVVLGGLLARVAMAVHSLGDFNLQIPATTWVFGALTAIAFYFATATPDRPEDAEAEDG